MAGLSRDDGLVAVPLDHDKVVEAADHLLVQRVLLLPEIVQICQEVGASNEDI